jgi:F420-dependent oxidoreductase-like protein
LRLATRLPYATSFAAAARKVVELEKAGLDLVYVAEAYGNDAVSAMGYLAAVTEKVEIGSGILPLYSRTPTLLAMTAAGMDDVSDGRFVLGLGASGPQVVEGFHGVPYDAPLGRTREIIEICRAVWAREAPFVYEGRQYQVPLPAGQGTGLGKPLKLVSQPRRMRIPIHVAALGPRNVAQTAELAEGWLPLFFWPEKRDRAFGAELSEGAARRHPSLPPLDIIAGGVVAIGDDVDDVLDRARPMAALYIGGMGAKGANFYNALVARYGYEKEAADIQDLYLSGRKKEAAATIPRDLLRSTNLIGSEGFVRDRLACYAAAGVTTLNLGLVGPTDVSVAMLDRLRSLMP